MDDRHFDNLARSVAGASRPFSRRGLGGLIGGVLGGVLLAVGGEDGAAHAECFKEDKRCRRDDQCCSGKCDHGFCTRCPDDSVVCEKVCVRRSRFESDPENCGQCGRRCDGDQRCKGGKCVAVGGGGDGNGGGPRCIRDCEPCSVSSDCCSGGCDGFCFPSQCREVGENCRADCQCCFGICDSKSGRCSSQKP